MRALVFDGELRLTDIPTPVLQQGQALLKMRRGGICNTDLELTRGYMGFSGVLGHEFVAEVVEGPSEWLGQRVVGEINIADGDCDMCRLGVPSQCRHRATVGINGHQGAFAEYMALTTRNLYAVPDEVSDDQAVFVEPLAAALQILEAVHVSPRDRVVVIGAGKLGLLSAQVLRLTGAEVQVVVRSDHALPLLNKWRLPALRADDLPVNQADVVVDCTGNAAGFAAALDLVKPRGTLVLKSTYADLPQANLTRVVVDEVRVIGSRCGPFAAALSLLRQGLIDTQAMIAMRYPFEQALSAFDRAFQPGTLKVLLDF
ncbi:MAG: alcohol dehydrogenase catalytic domain-containing protein [Anaerolineae bacterium]|nr:alcohol dehydrogenase catalytic domain-containing protein [Anaerolineae bacterium]MDW8173264.1 alcohol dehydrogenase catalytic domain-containing protein [Anaerolineae bacterium]